MNTLLAWNEWNEALAKKIGEILQIPVEATDIGRPQDAAWGDLSYPCFRVAKSIGKSPAIIAQELAEQLKGSFSWMEEVVAMGPYVNVRLSTSAAVSRVIEDVETLGSAYGTFPKASTGPLIFEYANPNTHKELHVGHLRNFVLGSAIVRTMQVAGRPIVPISYVNDVGSNVAKCLWQLVRAQGHFVKELTLEAVEEVLAAVPEIDRTGRYLGQLYTEVSSMEEDAGNTQEISFVQAQLEAHDPAWEALWKETRSWCLTELFQIFEELGVKVEKQYFESTYLDESGRLADELLAKGIAKESQGAIIVDLEEQKLGVMMIRKSDGNLLYATKDLSLSDQKLRDFPEASSFEVLVDVRQGLYFKQLGEVMRRRGVTIPFSFIGYEIVRLPEGTMSSRKGNVVTYQGLRDAVVDYAIQGVTERHTDWSTTQIAETARLLAQAGIVFSMLKQDNDKMIIFDMKEALSFDGATGPYCQYSVIRLKSILRKAATKGLIPSGTQTEAFTHLSEKTLALSLAAYPQVVALAGRDMRPSVIAHWCVETAQNINAFYRDVPVLDATPEEASARLRLAKAAEKVLTLGLGVLGIQIPNEM